jgi:HEAT repeat protein
MSPSVHRQETAACYRKVMPREDRVKLLLAPTLGPLRKVVDFLRALPWPVPVQRVTQRGLERLRARIPQLAELLGSAPQREAKRRQERAASSDLPALLSSLAARDYRTRAWAAQALATHGEAAAVDALVAALRDRSVEVAVAAATALSVSGGQRAREALLSVLENADGFYHTLTRAAAVHGLGALLAPAERAPVERALRDLDAEVSIAAISALIACAGGASADALLRVIENSDGFFLPITRLAAARGLERSPALDAREISRLRSRETDPLVCEVLERLNTPTKQTEATF